jgi:Sec-independent protein translocase protein TatA
MSLSELLVIFVVAFLVIKPVDLPKIVKKIKEFNRFFTKTKQEIVSYFDPETKKKDISLESDIEQINFYLEKIAKLGGEYEGEYSLDKIRERYHAVVKKSMKKNNTMYVDK